MPCSANSIGQQGTPSLISGFDEIGEGAGGEDLPVQDLIRQKSSQFALDLKMTIIKIHLVFV